MSVRRTVYVAELVESLLMTLCVITAHAHGCWLLNGRRSPFRRLYWWSIDARVGATPLQQSSHVVCPTCQANHDPSSLDPDRILTERDKMQAAYNQGVADGQRQALDYTQLAARGQTAGQHPRYTN